ncbi:MAG: M16 family metallopeptidase [Dissulfurimicrobium hydrothermale]|uniref:M16 family metallopeptidase n=1 Tax=Dissulfurimicrobium hydrothermale TaxID=1750598 RepID=UPI003C777FED
MVIKMHVSKKFFLILIIVMMLAFMGTAGAEEVVRAELENGLRVVMIRDPLAPVVTTVVNYLVGSDEAPEGFPGMAHAQEHMMFRGSPGLTAAQLARIAAEMGGDFGADTQQNVTQYFFTVPAEDLDVALHIEALRMEDVLDSERLWSEERGAIEQEVAQDLSNPEYIFYTRLLKDFFAGTPYEHDALGTRASFDKTTGAMLKQFYDKWYAPNNAILVICGDIDPSETLQKVKKLFGGIQTKRLPARKEVSLQPVKPAVLNMTTDRPYGMVSFAFRMPGYDSPDYAASVILADILNSQRSELYSLVSNGKALFTGFELDPLPRSGLGYVVAAFPSGADSRALMADVRDILLAVIKNGVPADLVAAAKLHEVTEAEFEKNSISGLAMSWSQALAVEGRNSPDDDIEAIQKVTAEDVNRVAAKYLDVDHSIQAVLTPEVSGKPVSSKGFGGSEKLITGHSARVELPEWAKEALSRPATLHPAVHPVVSTLKNGLVLIVQPISISNTVSVFGHIKNNPDMQVPKGQEGVDAILSQLFSYGSLSLDRVAFQKALDDIGASESAGTDFFIRVTPDHFDRGVQLLAENELHPALPKNAFDIVQKQAAASAAGELKSPGYLAEHAVKASLFPKNDPSLRHPTPQTISALTLDDVKRYYSSVFRPDMTTIVVIGKVTPEEVFGVINKYFGSWTAKGPRPIIDFPVVPNNKPFFVSVPDSSRVQDVVTMAQTLGLRRTDPDFYALELGNNVLGGGFYATKLYQDLRETTGLVYFVDSRLDAGKTRSVYSVVFACDPDKVSKAAGIVRRDLVDMQKVAVSDDQLNQAKALMLRKISLSESSVDQIAKDFIYCTANDLPLDEPVRAAKKYMGLTATDIRKAFSKWIRPNDMVQVVRGPVPQ